MRYLDRLRTLEISPDGLKGEPPKPPKPGFVGFEGATPTPFLNIGPANEAAIRAWLSHIGEVDPALITHCLEQCRRDPHALPYFLEQANAIPADDRRNCTQCANLTPRGACLAVGRREITEGPPRPPLRDFPQRCAGYMPKQDDPDQRPGYERWPGLASQFTKRKAAA